MEQQIAGHLSLDPPKPTSLKPDLPAGFDDVIARGMAKKPEERYQTTTELAAAARQALSPDTAGRTTPNYRRRHAAGRARAPGQARRCHPHRNPSAGRRHRCTGFADTRSDRHIAAFAGESSADPTPSPSAAPQNHRGRRGDTRRGHGVDHRIPIDRTVERIVLSIVQPIAVPIVPPDHLALHPPRRARRFGGEHCRRRLRRRSRQQPGDETRSGLQHSDHDAVYWPQGPLRVAVDAAGDVYVIDIPSDSRVSKLAAGASTQTVLPVHRPQPPVRCGGGHRGQRIRHRPQHQPGAETASGLRLLLLQQPNPFSGNNVSRCTPSCFKRAAFACAFPICLFVSWSRCATDSGRPRRYQSRAPEPFRSV